MKACEGIPTALLERGFLIELIAACIHIREGRVRNVLEELAIERLRAAAPEAGGDAAAAVPRRRRAFSGSA